MPLSRFAPVRLEAASNQEPARPVHPEQRRRDAAHTLECARRLVAAHDASVHDEEQQLLIRELMAHYRAWCLAQALPDPFVLVEAAARAEGVGRAERRMQQLAAAAIRRGTAPTPVEPIRPSTASGAERAAG